MATMTALITGANRGIGYEVALQLGSRGFHIILSGKDRDRIEGAVQRLNVRKVQAEPLVMDVADHDSIQVAFGKVSKNGSMIDVLVNNAGILLDEEIPLLEIRPGDFIRTFHTNAFGAFFVVQTFLPLLQRGSRVINISSGGGQILDGITTWAPVYCMSKTTLNVITMHLAEVLGPLGIPVNAMCPGWVRTEMGGQQASRSTSKGAETAVWLAVEADVKLTGKFFRDKKEINW